MTIQKGRQIAPIDELTVEPPRKTQDHREKIELPDCAVGSLKLELSKIHLRLIPRLRLKAHVGDLLTFLLDIMHRPFDDLIAPAKTHRAKPVVYPGRLVLHVFFKPCSKVTPKPIQQTLAVWLTPITLRISLILDVLLHGVSADAQFLGNLPLGQPLPLQHQYVQNDLLFFNAPPRLR